jgi:chromosome segregation ATPase
MSPESYVTIAVAIVTVLGSNAAFQFYTNRLRRKDQEDDDRRNNAMKINGDLRERVAVLESKLERAEREKDEMQQEMIKLIESLASIKAEVEFLRRENAYLKAQTSQKL